ncbi:MAG: toxin co-regulated pilus biosynthesis Q family protein [Alphaproteobacteria bacterium]|nr:toxin co-regulated pilus biosynthesis Q family protein [Alphaproteobacteria bacterium]
MFRKILIAAMLATAAGYCFAAGAPEQVVTSEVFYTEERDDESSQSNDGYYVQGYQEPYNQQEYEYQQVSVAPAWPIGSEADVTVSCDTGVCSKKSQSDNIKIVSKIGSDLVVENNFNLGARDGSGWSGGANMLHGTPIPTGFDSECVSGAEMPLLQREVLEDDGGNVLAVSRSGRKKCVRYADGYDAYLARNGLVETTVNGDVVTGGGVITVNNNGVVSVVDPMQDTLIVSGDTEIAVDLSADAEPSVALQDQVRSWVVASGQTLREVLQSWCDKEGWDLVWTTSREYPIEASAVFKGRFVDVASAVVRNFGRAIPVPYAKFYKGNRVLVISTTEE